MGVRVTVWKSGVNAVLSETFDYDLGRVIDVNGRSLIVSDDYGKILAAFINHQAYAELYQNQEDNN